MANGPADDERHIENIQRGLAPADDSPPPTSPVVRVRLHRGSLADAMATAQEVRTREEFEAFFRAGLPFGAPEGELRIESSHGTVGGADERIDWKDTLIVSLPRWGVLGMCDGAPDVLPVNETDAQLARRLRASGDYPVMTDTDVDEWQKVAALSPAARDQLLNGHWKTKGDAPPAAPEPLHPPCSHGPRQAGQDGTLWPCAWPDCESRKFVEVVEAKTPGGTLRYRPRSELGRDAEIRWRWVEDDFIPEGAKRG